jgi:hypothetical protein
MNHYLVCDNAQCRFVLDVRINGASAGRTPFVPKTCPLCGSKWSSGHPLPLSALGVELLDNLPHCSCCSRKKRPVVTRVVLEQSPAHH